MHTHPNSNALDTPFKVGNVALHKTCEALCRVSLHSVPHNDTFVYIPPHTRSPMAPRVENSSYMGSAATGLYPALTDGQFVLHSEDAAGHIASRRRDVDVGLTEAEKVWFSRCSLACLALCSFAASYCS